MLLCCFRTWLPLAALALFGCHVDVDVNVAEGSNALITTTPDLGGLCVADPGLRAWMRERRPADRQPDLPGVEIGVVAYSRVAGSVRPSGPLLAGGTRPG